MSSYYNPRGYVRGGASPAVARATVALARRRPLRRPAPMAPISVGTVPSAIPARRPAAAPVDPLIARSQGLVEQMFSPLLARLGQQRAAAEANARKAAEASGTALGSALQASGAPITQAYDTGIAQSAAVNEAVANRLNSAGGTAGDELKAKLAQISADPSTATAVSDVYRNAGNAGYAAGGADLQHLIGRRSEAGAYQGKLPGIARLTANQGLERALSDFRGEFGAQEQELTRDALGKAFELYGGFRQEQQAAKEQKSREKQALIETAQRERASLRALAAASQTNAEKLNYQKMEKELDRQLKWDIAQLGANTRIATDNPPKPGAVTGPANQAWISKDGKKIKNPNWHGTWKGNTPVPPKAGTSGNDNDSWVTPGSSKRDRVVKAAETAVISYGEDGGQKFTPEVLRHLRRRPQMADQIINSAINAAIKKQVPGVNLNSAAAKEIRAAVRQQLDGKQWTALDKKNWEFEA